MNKPTSAAKTLTIQYTLLQSAFWASFATIWGFATVYLLYKGFENTQIGIILSLATIISIFLQPLLASYIDRNKKVPLKYFLFFLMLILFILALFLYFVPNINLLIASVFVIIGSILMSTVPLTYSLALEYMNIGISMNFGLARGLGSLSFAVMSYFIGMATEEFSPTLVVPTFAAICLFMMLILYTFQSPSTYENLPSKAKDYLTSKNDKIKTQNLYSFYKSNRSFFLLLFGFSLLFMSHNFINSYHINIINNVGGNDADMGLSVGVAAALELPIMAAFAFLVSKVRCSILMKISAFFFFIKAIIIYLAPSVAVVLVSQSFQIFAYALFTLACVYYVNDIMNEENKARGQALVGAATMGVGGTLGNFIGGRVLDAYDVSTMLMIGVVASFIGFLIILVSTKDAKA